MTNPASYPANDAAEKDAINLFECLVDSNYIKTDIKSRDKHPNIDGSVEIVRKEEDRYIPIGKFDIQIRKIPGGATKYSCPSSLVGYSKVTLLPLLLICADTDEKRVFWKHVTVDMPEFKENQDKFTIKFDPAVDVIDKNLTYMSRWTEIVESYQQQRASYPNGA